MSHRDSPKSISSLFRDPERIPSSRDSHLWSDYLELRCLLDMDLEYSKSDLLEHIRQRTDLKENNVETLYDGDGTSQIGAELGDQTQGEVNDKQQLFGDDLFRHIDFRIAEFKNFYPFRLSQGRDVLRRKRKLNKEQKLYIFLLLSSQLRYFSKQDQNWLTDDFELVCHQALKNYLPENAPVFMFGKNRLNIGPFNGKLKDKVKNLATALNETTTPDVEHIPESDTGDNGLDLVAWLDAGDTNKSVISFFAQCACSNETWVDKQAQSSYDTWKELLTFKVRPVNIIFIPFSYRDCLGDWHRPHNIHDSFIVDRLRALRMLKNNFARVMKLNSFTLVNKVAA